MHNRLKAVISAYDHSMYHHDRYDHLMSGHDRSEAGGMCDLSMDRLLSTWFVQMNMDTGMGTCRGTDMAV